MSERVEPAGPAGPIGPSGPAGPVGQLHGFYGSQLSPSEHEPCLSYLFHTFTSSSLSQSHPELCSSKNLDDLLIITPPHIYYNMTARL